MTGLRTAGSVPGSVVAPGAGIVPVARVSQGRKQQFEGPVQVALTPMVSRKPLVVSPLRRHPLCRPLIAVQSPVLMAAPKGEALALGSRLARVSIEVFGRLIQTPEVVAPVAVEGAAVEPTVVAAKQQTLRLVLLQA